MQPPTLPVAIASSQSISVSESGEPIWPIANGEEYDALAALARTFGAELREVRGEPGWCGGDRGHVAWLDEEMGPLAALHAHLSGRRASRIHAIDELAALEGSIVVLLDPQTLARVIGPLLVSSKARPIAPGILLARSYASMRKQVLLRSAAARLGRVCRVGRVELDLLAPFERVEQGEVCRFGGRAATATIREALGGGAGLLSVVTHSDGVDAYLGPGSILCSIGSTPKGTTRVPRCVSTGICHRRATSIDHARASGVLVTPDAVSARALFWGSCWGVLPMDGTVDPAWSVLEGLLDNPRVGAVVAAPGVAFVGREHVEALHAPGDRPTLGEAVAALHRSEVSGRWGCQFLLFGDPELGIPPVRLDATRSPRLHVTRSAPLGQEASILRAILHQASSDPGDIGPALAKHAARGLAALQRYTCGPSPAALCELQSTMLSVICGGPGPDLFDAWLSLASTRASPISPAATCWACRDPDAWLSQLEACFPDPSWTPRRLSFCRRCGLIEDAPAHSGLCMQVDGNTVSLAGPLPRERWAASVMVKSVVPAERAWSPWPASKRGEPQRRVRLIAPHPFGPVDVAVVLLHDAELTIVSQKVRMDNAARESSAVGGA